MIYLFMEHIQKEVLDDKVQISVPKVGLEWSCAADNSSANVEVTLHNFEGLLLIWRLH